MKPLSILLADGNPGFLTIASQFFQQQDPAALVLIGTARNSEETLEKTFALRPDAVLIDLFVPGVGGLSVLPTLRSMAPNVGIVVLSVTESEGYRRAALAAGADEFVSKLRVYQDLVPAIHRACLAHRKSTSETPRTGTSPRDGTQPPGPNRRA